MFIRNLLFLSCAFECFYYINYNHFHVLFISTCLIHFLLGLIPDLPPHAQVLQTSRRICRLKILTSKKSIPPVDHCLPCSCCVHAYHVACCSESCHIKICIGQRTLVIMYDVIFLRSLSNNAM